MLDYPFRWGEGEYNPVGKSGIVFLFKGKELETVGKLKIRESSRGNTSDATN